MPTPDIAFMALKTTVQGLESAFMSPLLASRVLQNLTSNQALHLSAYVVLAHAAFEEYFEALALWGLDTAVTNWRMGVAGRSATTLILHSGKVTSINDESKDVAFDRVRIALDSIKKTFSGFITKDNHGISIKYLRKLFYPLGIDIPSDIRLVGSLNTLAGVRGSAAHTATRGVKKHLDPKSTLEIVADCLEFAAEMKKRVIAIR